VKQLSLFVTGGDYRREKATQMSEDFLFAWKERIADYQRQVREGKTAIEQPTLFDLPQPHGTLPMRSILFLYRVIPGLLSPSRHRTPRRFQSRLSLFQIDHVSNIVLYVGETKLSARRRWLGSHDCKDYVLTISNCTAATISMWPLMLPFGIMSHLPKRYYSSGNGSLFLSGDLL